MVKIECVPDKLDYSYETERALVLKKGWDYVHFIRLFGETHLFEGLSQKDMTPGNDAAGKIIDCMERQAIDDKAVRRLNAVADFWAFNDSHRPYLSEVDSKRTDYWAVCQAGECLRALIVAAGFESANLKLTHFLQKKESAIQIRNVLLLDEQIIKLEEHDKGKIKSTISFASLGHARYRDFETLRDLLLVVFHYHASLGKIIKMCSENVFCINWLGLHSACSYCCETAVNEEIQYILGVADCVRDKYSLKDYANDNGGGNVAPQLIVREEKVPELVDALAAGGRSIDNLKLSQLSKASMAIVGEAVREFQSRRYLDWQTYLHRDQR